MSDVDPKSVINSISDTWTNGKIIQVLINVDGFQVLKHRIIPKKLFKRVKLDRDGSLDLINIPLCIIDQNCIAQIHEKLFNPTKFNTQFNILENLESTISLDQIKLPELALLSLKIANARLDKKNHISLEYEPSHFEIYDLTLENISTITGIHFYINN